MCTWLSILISNIESYTAVFSRFQKFVGHFDPLGLGSGGNFQILEIISYIMYIIVTSDVNKNATFWGSSLMTEIGICRKCFSPLSFGNLWSILTGNPVENILVDWGSGQFLYFTSGTNLVTDRILRRFWSRTLIS